MIEMVGFLLNPSVHVTLFMSPSWCIMCLGSHSTIYRSASLLKVNAERKQERDQEETTSIFINKQCYISCFDNNNEVPNHLK